MSRPTIFLAPKCPLFWFEIFFFQKNKKNVRSNFGEVYCKLLVQLAIKWLIIKPFTIVVAIYSYNFHLTIDILIFNNCIAGAHLSAVNGEFGYFCYGV